MTGRRTGRNRAPFSLAGPLLQRLAVDDTSAAAQQLHRPSLLLVPQDLVHGGTRRSGQLGDRLLGQRHDCFAVRALVQVGELEQSSPHAFVDRVVDGKGSVVRELVVCGQEVDLARHQTDGAEQAHAPLQLLLVIGRHLVDVDGHDLVVLLRREEIHVHRVINRWGYVQTKTPEQTLKALEPKLPMEYRPAINRFLWELPAGSVDEGEEPDQAAVRECHEEIGLVPATVVRLASLFPTPGFCDESMVFYRCTKLTRPTRHVEADVDEQIEPRVFTLGAVRALIARGQIVDMKTVLGLGLVSLRRRAR